MTREQAAGLNEILQASLNRKTLKFLEEKYQNKVNDLTASLESLPVGHSHEDGIRHRMGPTGERIAVLHELVIAAQKQRERLERAGVS